MADGNNYRENRWFKPWNMNDGYGLTLFKLPEIIQSIVG
jgi:hypothetical protein